MGEEGHFFGTIKLNVVNTSCELFAWSFFCFKELKKIRRRKGLLSILGFLVFCCLHFFLGGRGGEGEIVFLSNMFER